jgi:hypothetical protein
MVLSQSTPVWQPPYFFIDSSFSRRAVDFPHSVLTTLLLSGSISTLYNLVQSVVGVLSRWECSVRSCTVFNATSLYHTSRDSRDGIHTPLLLSIHLVVDALWWSC